MVLTDLGALTLKQRRALKRIEMLPVQEWVKAPGHGATIESDCDLAVRGSSFLSRDPVSNDSPGMAIC